MKRIMTDTEAWAIAGALRLAAEEYGKSADQSPYDGLSITFMDQQTQALKLAEEFEGASSITITD